MANEYCRVSSNHELNHTRPREKDVDMRACVYVCLANAYTLHLLTAAFMESALVFKLESTCTSKVEQNQPAMLLWNSPEWAINGPNSNKSQCGSNAMTTRPATRASGMARSSQFSGARRHEHRRQ